MASAPQMLAQSPQRGFEKVRLLVKIARDHDHRTRGNDFGEVVEQVCEETGLTVRITEPLDDIRYTFVQHGTRIHKTVHYFMMEPTGGSMEGHDREFEEVRWISFVEAASLLSFETERGLVGLAATRLPDGAA